MPLLKNITKLKSSVFLSKPNYSVCFTIMNRLIRFRRYCVSYLQRNMSSGAPAPPEAETGKSMSARFRPSNFQKTILVWTKKYKSKEEIPNFVSAEVIERARSEARIKISNILMLLTALASFGAVLAGKAAAKRGESVHQMNLDWHKQYQDEVNAKEATK